MIHKFHTLHLKPNGKCKEITHRNLDEQDKDYLHNMYFCAGTDDEGWAIWKIPSMLKVREVDKQIAITTDCTDPNVAREYAFRVAAALYPYYDWTRLPPKYGVSLVDGGKYEIRVSVVDICQS